MNEMLIHQNARTRPDYIDEIDDELRKYTLKVTQDKKEAAARSWWQWEIHALASSHQTEEAQQRTKPHGLRYWHNH